MLDPRLAPFWLAALAGPGLCRPEPPGSLRSLGLVDVVLALFNVALYWICIPYRTQQRFLLQAVGLAAVPLARLLDRSVWLARAATVLLALHLLTPQPWPLALREEEIPWDLSPFIPNVVPAPLPLVRLVEHRATRSWTFAADAQLAAASGAWLLRRPGGLGLDTAIAVSTRGRLRNLALLAARFPRAGQSGCSGDRGRRSGFAEFWFIRVSVTSTGAGRTWKAVPGRAEPGSPMPARTSRFICWARAAQRGPYVNVDGHRDWLMHDYHRAAIARGEPTWPNSRPGWDRAQSGLLGLAGQPSGAGASSFWS